jgi:hypothetical protein
MQPPGNARESCEQIARIHSRPFGHVDARLNVDAIGRRMKNKKLEMMGYGRPGGPVGASPDRTRPGTGSKPG